MQQYLNLLREIKARGTHKKDARPGLPGTTSLFGYQFRHDLSRGFPLLTTKKMFWKGIVLELLWFLRGDTNIKYLVDNGVNIWNKDAYNYYCKQLKTTEAKLLWTIPANEFIHQVKDDSPHHLKAPITHYEWGDCGYQYGRMWRNWTTMEYDSFENDYYPRRTDQILNLIQGLIDAPESRRHILNSIDPGHEDQLALYWCHGPAQFNCREMTREQRQEFFGEVVEFMTTKELDERNVPKYYLDCGMYQRSADAILGVPFNIASYALLTHILCVMCNMAPGEMIYSYGDAHIYDNHIAACDENLGRVPRILPSVQIEKHVFDLIKAEHGNKLDSNYLDHLFRSVNLDTFKIIDYNPSPKLDNEAELNAGI